MRTSSWSKQDEKFLSENFLAGRSLWEIAKELKRSYTACKSRITLLKVKKNAKHYWTDEEIKLLRDLYPDHQGKEIEKIMGIKMSAIYQRAALLGLEKSEAFRKSPLAGGFQKGSTIGAAYRFKKGQVPPNKGLKLTEYVKDEQTLDRIRKTQFKKGQLPKNTHYDGKKTIRIDKNGRRYWWIRIALGKWEMLHVHLWKQINARSVPEGMIIVFDDNDSMNLDPKNLICITREEHMERSRMRDGTLALKIAGRDKQLQREILKHPELLKLKKEQITLNKKINEATKQA